MFSKSVALSLLGSIVLMSNSELVSSTTYLYDDFSSVEAFEKDWIQSKWKSESDMGKWALTSGDWYGDKEINQGMQTSQDAKFYAISKKIEPSFSNKGKDLVVQFSVKNEKKGSSFCGGGYIKLLPKGTDQEKFGGDSPYFIMFGPDICGYDVSRVHLIFNHEGKNLLRKKDIKLEYADKDEFTHLYTLVVSPDNSYKVYFDLKERASGNLHDGDWDFPPKEIDDPTDKKPADWVDEKKIPDPSDVKPAGYDDVPEKIVDPEAKKPEDWDDNEDGAWEPPMIDNPAFKGEWKQKMMDNPAYKGEWKAKTIANKDFKENVSAFDDIGVVGFELWVVNSGSIFDNIYIGDSFKEAEELAAKTFLKAQEPEKAAKKAIDDKLKAEEEANKKESGEADTASDDEKTEDL